MQRIISVIIFISLNASCLVSHGQSIKNIDNELTAAYRKMEYFIGRDEGANPADTFYNLMWHDLQNPATFKQRLDSLSLSDGMAICTSKDGKLKTYAWDTYGGGTWHDYVSIAQYQTAGGIVLKKLSSDTEPDASLNYDDSYVYNILMLKTDSTPCYLTMGDGIKGSTLWDIMRLFAFRGDSLIENNTCFADSLPLVIEHNRMGDCNLKVDVAKNQIIYNVSPTQAEIDSNSYAKGKRVWLQWVKGKFILVKTGPAVDDPNSPYKFKEMIVKKKKKE